MQRKLRALPFFIEVAQEIKVVGVLGVQRVSGEEVNTSNLDASDIVSQVGGIYAGLNERDQLVKPRSSLPCSWFAARECFMRAYEREYLVLDENLVAFRHKKGE